jgi:hypothetical protein
LVATLSSIGTGCSSCEAKCTGPSAEIFVSNDVAAVKVCDFSGLCTEEVFDQPGAQTQSRSFTMSAVERNGRIPLTISGSTRAGAKIASVQLVAKPAKGSCGCSGSAPVFVDTSGAHLFDR